jgi:hypothetical protein
MNERLEHGIVEVRENSSHVSLEELIQNLRAKVSCR